MYKLNCVLIDLKRILIALLMINVLLAPAWNQVHAASSNANSPPQRWGAVQTSTLLPNNPETLAEFGYAVSISGNLAVIGARNADPDQGDGLLVDAGAAYIFTLTGTGWVQEAQLIANDAEPGDTFGVSVAIDGQTVVVGATGVNSGKEKNAGAAYVFSRDGTTWKQKAKLVSPDPMEDDAFGTSVALDGITIVVGADSKDVYSIPDVGSAYVFIKRGGSWDQKATLLPFEPSLGGYFGGAVDIDGSRIIVGATQANLLAEPDTGTAFIFRGGGNSWKPEAKLSLDNGRQGDFFGHAVAIDGNTAVVSAVFRDPDLGFGRVTNAGSVLVYRLNGGKWTLQVELSPTDAEPFAHFGQSVALSAGALAVGANGKTQEGFAEAGAVYLYTRKGTEWLSPIKIVADSVMEEDGFGKAVALSGERMIIGANGRDAGDKIGSGQGYAYRLTTVELPETGFAPGRLTTLTTQPASKAYADLGELWLEIPSLHVETAIIGIPEIGDGWDTAWLGGKAGYLQGTAFPTWQGNSAIAAHKVLSDGEAGPFADLHRLVYGDRIIIHGWNQQYLYEVRTIERVQAQDMSALRHEELPWLTLITCRDFDEAAGRYPWRTIVRAVQVDIIDE
jgi:LPXTG-site transpeptidase (sortase) family protein